MYFIFLIVATFCNKVTDILFDSENTCHIIDTVSENNTYIIRDLSSKSFYISLKLTEQDINFFMLVTVGEVLLQFEAYYQEWVHIDWNSQYENRLTRFIKVESANQIIYITTTGSIPQSYQLSVRSSNDDYFCPNDCSNNGACSSEGCLCYKSYIGDDCHQKAIEIILNVDMPIELQKEKVNFFYLPTKPELFENANDLIKFETKCETGLVLFIEKTESLYIPEDYNAQYSQIIEINKISLQIPLIKSIFMLYTNDSILIFAAKQIIETEDCNLLISFGEQNEFNVSSSITTIIIVVTISVAVLFIFLIFCIYKKLREYLQNLSERRFSNLRNAAATMATCQQGQVIEYLIPVTDKQIKGEDTCAICLDSLNNQKEVRLTPCHHNFHTECLKLWLDKTLQCPNCRTSLTLQHLLDHHE